MNELFYDPKFGLSSALAFMRRARSQGYSPKEITDFLRKQEVNQVHKEVHKTDIHFFPLWGQGAGSYQMDLMFLYDPKKRTEQLPILTIINVNSRKLYAYVLKNRKTGEIVRGLTKWLGEVVEKPSFLQSDNEKAFTAKEVGALLGSHGIVQSFVEPEDHRGQAEVERVHQTLRRLFTLYEDAFHKPWLTDFNDLIWNYNHRVNRDIGTEPWEANENAGTLRRLAQRAEAEKDFEKFKVGDRVRKAVFNRDVNRFDKGRSKWSTKVYTITGTNGFHLYQLDDANKSFQPHYNLQLIDGEPEKRPAPPELSLEEVRTETTKKKKSIRSLRKEGLKNHLTSGAAETLEAEKRQAKVPQAFVAEPAPPQQTLDRSHLKPTRKNAPRKPLDPDTIRYAQAKFKGNKYSYGKVVKEGGAYRVKFTTGEDVLFSPEQLIAARFPLTPADRKNLPKVQKLLGE